MQVQEINRTSFMISLSLSVMEQLQIYSWTLILNIADQLSWEREGALAGNLQQHEEISCPLAVPSSKITPFIGLLGLSICPLVPNFAW